MSHGIGVTLQCDCRSRHIRGSNATIISNGVILAGDFECMDCGTKWSTKPPSVGDLFILGGEARTITSVTGDRVSWQHEITIKDAEQ